MILPHHPVHRFLLKVLFWLPICFALWYWLAGIWLYPVWWAMDGFFTRLFPGIIETLERHGHLLEIVTRIKAPQSPDTPYVGTPILTFEIRPLIYAYSLPLYAALTLAAPAPTKILKALHLVGGLLALLPFVAWGAGFEILKHLAFTLGPQTAPYIDFSGIRQELIAWGYQFGYLILPGVVPLAMWIALHRSFLEGLAPNLFERAQPRVSPDHGPD